MYIVLSDDSTYDGATGCSVVILTPSGVSNLEQSNDFKHTTWNEVSAAISLEDLVDCYVRNNPHKSFTLAVMKQAEEYPVIDDG